MRRFLEPVCIFLFAAMSARSQDQTTVRINEIQTANAFTLEDENGDTPDWIELGSVSAEPVPLAGCGLSDDPDVPFRWTFPDVRINPNSYLVVFASGKDRRDPSSALHANFEIDSDGEILQLTAPDGRVLDSVSVGPVPLDASYGRPEDGAGGWAYFDAPSPGRGNGPGFAAIAGPVRLSPGAGFYQAGVSVSVSGPAGSTVRYTLDGSEPDRHAPAASGPVRIRNTAVLRTRAFDPAALPGPVSTATFFIDEPSDLPVLSISTDPDYLFDPDIGIYVIGNGTAMGGYPDAPVGPPANYWEDWVRPAQVEWFEQGGGRGFGIGAGIKMHGKTTRNLPQKSFTVLLRGKYGAKTLEYPFFPGLPVSRFRSFLVRNAGSDNTANRGGVQFRDGLAARLVRNLDLEVQAYRPCVLFLNGVYWGVYELRENQNADYLASHHGADPEAVDILDDYHRLYPLAVQGSTGQYDALIDFLQDHALSDPDAVEPVNRRIDVDNYLTYMAVQVIWANQDGPGHNCQFWRPQSQDGRFRWLLYDADHAFGLLTFVPSVGYNPGAYADNTLAYYREENGPAWPNPPESTFLFRKILECADFRDRFVNRVADLLNSVFLPDSVLSEIERIRSSLEPEMGRHFERWGGSESEWEESVGAIETFGRLRPGHLREIVRQEFALEGPCSLSVFVSPEGCGRVRVNSLQPGRLPWSGVYFKGVPVRIAAVPNSGYRFAAWTGAESQADTAFIWMPAGNASLTARFILDPAGVETDGRVIPAVFELSPNFPNPFNASTRIEYSLPSQTTVRLSVFDASGREVCILAQGRLDAGRHAAAWDGKHRGGSAVPSGVYLVRLRAGAFVETRKMALIR